MSVLKNLEYYKVFFYVAKYQNITHAAQALYLTQPAATRTLQQLEYALDCQLLIRSSRGVTLTAEGEMLYQALIPAFDALMDAQKKIEQMHSLQNGLIRIGVNNLATEYIIKRLMLSFNQDYPGISTTLSRIHVDEISNSLQNGWIDFAFIMDIGDDRNEADIPSADFLQAEDMECYNLGLFPDVFLVGPKYADMAKRLVSREELSALPLIVPISMRSTVRYYLRTFRGQEVPGPADLTVNGAESRLMLAQRNFGLTYFTGAFVRQQLKNQQLFKVNTAVPVKENRLYILTKNKRPLSIASQTLIERLKKVEI